MSNPIDQLKGLDVQHVCRALFDDAVYVLPDGSIDYVFIGDSRWCNINNYPNTDSFKKNNIPRGSVSASIPDFLLDQLRGIYAGTRAEFLSAFQSAQGQQRCTPKIVELKDGELEQTAQQTPPAQSLPLCTRDEATRARILSQITE